MVQGVVVQMTIHPLPFGSIVKPKAFASFSGSAKGKPASTAMSFLSMYSTSASASAEPQSKHQFTGFKPR
jgi:hypothetical protein